MICQIMKANGVQCSNQAFAIIGKVPVCRLDLNWQLDAYIKEKRTITAEMVSVLEPVNQAELDKIIAFANETIAKAE